MMLGIPREADHLAYVQVWQGIVAAMQEGEALAESHASAAASQEMLPELRRKMRALLGRLAKDLSALLGPAEAQEVLLPLVLICDELVLKRLPKNARQAWPLLQAELYGINDGGEKFFQLIDEKLLQVQPSALLLEVLLYCLGRGFLGRYVNEPAKVLPYKDRLKERLHLHPRQARLASQYRQAERRVHGPKDLIDAEGHRPLIAPVLLYTATFLLMLAVPFGIVFLSNLPFALSATSSAQPSASDQAPPDRSEP